MKIEARGRPNRREKLALCREFDPWTLQVGRSQPIHAVKDWPLSPQKPEPSWRLRLGSSETDPSPPLLESVAAPPSSRNGGEHEQAARVRQFAERPRSSEESSSQGKRSHHLEVAGAVSPPHIASGARARTRSDSGGVGAGVQRTALHRGCGDDHGIRTDPHGSTTSSGGRRRCTRCVGRRTSVWCRLDQSSEWLEPDQARQQHAGIPQVDAGALLQGRRLIRAFELQLDPGLGGICGRSDPRCQGD